MEINKIKLTVIQKKKKWFCCLVAGAKARWHQGESESEVAQSPPTLWDPMDCSLPGSSLHGILQARVLEGIAISFSRGSSRPWNWTQISHIPGWCFNLWATREAQRRYSANKRKCQKLWVKKGLKTGQYQDNGRSGQCRGEREANQLLW